MHHSSQNLTPKNIASILKNIQHSNNRLWQHMYIVWTHKQSNLWLIQNYNVTFKNKHNSFLYCFMLEVIAFGPDGGDKSNDHYLFILQPQSNLRAFGWRPPLFIHNNRSPALSKLGCLFMHHCQSRIPCKIFHKP